MEQLVLKVTSDIKLGVVEVQEDKMLNQVVLEVVVKDFEVDHRVEMEQLTLEVVEVHLIVQAIQDKVVMADQE